MGDHPSGWPKPGQSFIVARDGGVVAPVGTGPLPPSVHAGKGSEEAAAEWRHGMRFLLLAAAFMWAATILAAPVRAQEAKQEARQEGREASPQQPGRAVVLSKCFQCHTDAMFRDQRQDRRAWESTIYRMVGRGALWTPEEIKLMADYLGAEYGTAAKPAAAPR